MTVANPLLDDAAYVDLLHEHVALDGVARRARGTLRRLARDIPDIAHASQHDGPVEELLDQLLHRLDGVVAQLDAQLDKGGQPT